MKEPRIAVSILQPLGPGPLFPHFVFLIMQGVQFFPKALNDMNILQCWGNRFLMLQLPSLHHNGGVYTPKMMFTPPVKTSPTCFDFLRDSKHRRTPAVRLPGLLDRFFTAWINSPHVLKTELFPSKPRGPPRWVKLHP